MGFHRSGAQIPESDPVDVEGRAANLPGAHGWDKGQWLDITRRASYDGTMEDLSQRIESRIRSLGASGAFGPPANDTSILAAEAVFGVALPDDLRASLAIHNGDAVKKLDGGGWQSDGPFAHVEWLSLGAMLSEWEVWQDTIAAQGLEPEAEGPVKALWWNPRWIPFTVIGGSTWHHCVDLDPAEEGRPGQVIEIADDDASRRVVAPSLRAFLEQMATDLEAGRYTLDDEHRLVHDSWA